MAISSTKLGEAIESVEGRVAYRGRQLRVVVPESVLRKYLGAGEDPQSWLRSFESHTSSIEMAAVLRYEATGQSPVILYEIELKPGFD